MKMTQHPVLHGIASLLLLATLAGCGRSFLEVKPKGRVIAAKTSDYDLLFNNLDLINTDANGHLIMGDEVVAVEPFFAGAAFRDKQYFQWDTDVYTTDVDANETEKPVKALYVYNKIINEVLDATEGTDARNRSLQAEAFVGRAWTYFLLINYYGKPYDPATAATDPGFPLITEADINGGPYTRASVQAIYDLIVSDLTAAIPNLIDPGITHRTRVSRATAQGLLAKVYVYMGRHAEALPLLEQAIPAAAASPLPCVLLDFNTAFQFYPTVPNDPENIYARRASNPYSDRARLLWLTPEAASRYSAGDVRRARWLQATEFPNGETLYRLAGLTSVYYGLRVPELHLLLAEVKARLDDLPGAVSALENFRRHRMPAEEATVPDGVSAEKLPLLRFIMEERIREFPMMGYRWYDMRRLSVDPLFGQTAFQHRVYDENGDVKETYSLSDPKQFVFRIPPKILAENPQMQDNP